MAKETGDLQGFKVVLKSGKTVLLREPLIKHQELAFQLASTKTSNETMIGLTAQKELLKQLIIEVDGKAVDKSTLENLDNVFKYAEYMQMQKVLASITGGEDLGEFKTEIVSYGGK